MTLPAELRSGTRTHHRALEAALDLPRRLGSPVEVGRALAVLLAAWTPLECALSSVDGWQILGLSPRLGEASPLLAADLAELGVAEPPPPTAPRPTFASLAAAVGGRYVLLGSALGGQVIARDLGALPTRFFRRDGQDPGADWHRFRDALTQHEWSAPERQTALDTARQTFEFVGAVAREQRWPLPG